MSEVETALAGVYPFAKVRFFLMTWIGLMWPLTVWGAVHFALLGRGGDSAFLSIVSVPLLALNAWVWYRLLTDRPALVLGDGVLINRISPFSIGRVYAGEISDVRVVRGLWSGVLLEFRREQGRLLRGSTTIPTGFLALSAQLLADDIDRWRERYTTAEPDVDTLARRSPPSAT